MCIAVNHGYDGVQWYLSTRSLEMVCLDLCVSCRDLAISHVVVNDDTPRHLYLRRTQDRLRGKRRASRIPALRVRSITWGSSPARISVERHWTYKQPAFLDSGWRWGLTKQECINNRIPPWWPESLRRMTFGASFNYSVSSVSLYTSPSPRDLSTSRMPSSA